MSKKKPQIYSFFTCLFRDIKVTILSEINTRVSQSEYLAPCLGRGCFHKWLYWHCSQIPRRNGFLHSSCLALLGFLSFFLIYFKFWPLPLFLQSINSDYSAKLKSSWALNPNHFKQKSHKSFMSLLWTIFYFYWFVL